MRSILSRWLIVVLAVVVNCVSPARAADNSRDAIVERVRNDVQYFSSDELEGRGIDTPGIELAADRILDVYRELEIKPAFPDGSYRQTFEVPLGNIRINESTSVIFTNGDTKRTLKLNSDFQPQRRGTSGSASGELVFVGYGISSEEDSYDDYASVDVEGRILVMIRREPQQGREDGAFAGTETTVHSYIDRKIKLAVERKAVGIVFVNDPHSSPTAEKDELMPSSGFGGEEGGIPFVHVKQRVVNELLAASPLKVPDADAQLTNLADVAAYIDEHLKPVSQPLSDWTADVTTDFTVNSVTASNLIGVIEGEGELADETIVVGGHYDHIGYGGFGSRAPNRKGEIHNGADDNATGTAAVLEVARRVAAGPTPKRRIVFICFSAEERGLLGSRYYISHPVIPLEKTVAMLNYDMIGTLRNNRVEVNGVGTAVEFRSVVTAADDLSPLDIKIVDGPFAGSDHLPFYQKQIPVMFCFTGITPRYHTPDDDFDAINVEGVVSIIDYSEQLLRGIDSLESRPQFRKVERRARRRIPVLGIRPDLAGDSTDAGVQVQGVTADSGAAEAGIKVGDLVTRIAQDKIESFDDIRKALEKHSVGATVEVALVRGEEELVVKVKLGAP